MIVFFVISMFLALALAKPIIKLLRNIKAGATIQEELSLEQQKKVGTPLMGGFIFIIPIVIISSIYVFLNQQHSYQFLVFLIFTLGYGLIGFIDDYIKVIKKDSDGLSAIQKIIFQIGILVLYLIVTSIGNLDTTIFIPLLNSVVDLKFFYIAFLLVFSIGFSNAVNLTDGMDGLLAGCFIISSTAYFFVSKYVLNEFTQVIALIVIGSLLAYLKFNYHPAKIFMGDTGSLALGGVLISYALLTKTEFLLLIIGMIYVIEAFSVIIQVIYFKLTKGKRIFLMSPIHHHFALAGYSEIQIVWGFWALSIVFGAIGIMILYVV